MLVVGRCRPFFTVWVTGVQIAVFCVMLAVYGIAPINVHKVITTQVVRRLLDLLCLRRVGQKHSTPSLWP